jgi:hypothetical protein
MCTYASNVVACCSKVNIKHAWRALYLLEHEVMQWTSQRRRSPGCQVAHIIYVEEAHWCCCRLSTAGSPTPSQPVHSSHLAKSRCIWNRWWNRASTGQRSWHGRQSRRLPVWCTCQQDREKCTLTRSKESFPAHSCWVHSLHNMRA